MDGLANVSTPQQSQLSIKTSMIEKQTPKIEVQIKPKEKEEISKIDVLQKIENDDREIDFTINSKEQMDELITELNEAVSPMNTSLEFGVDKDNIFFVAVMDKETNQMIRRFPAEKAVSFLSKMQEVTGILFDSKG